MNVDDRSGATALDSIVSVNFCRSAYRNTAATGAADLAANCFVTSADGAVAALCPSSQLLLPLAQTRLQSAAEQDLERQLYLRESPKLYMPPSEPSELIETGVPVGNMDAATASVLQLAHDSLECGNSTKAAELMRLLEPQPSLLSGASKAELFKFQEFL